MFICVSQFFGFVRVVVERA